MPGTPPAKSFNHRNTGNRYVGPIYYVPNVYDASSWSDYSNAAYPPPLNSSYAVQPPPTQPQPIIINQYFDAKHEPIQPEDAPPAVQDSTLKPGDPLSEPQNYYLIQYKDHTIYSALAYWVEGDTLHYVTTQNTHNQASLSLIDLDKTYKLNEDRSVPFSIPGK